MNKICWVNPFKIRWTKNKDKNSFFFASIVYVKYFPHLFFVVGFWSLPVRMESKYSLMTHVHSWHLKLIKQQRSNCSFGLVIEVSWHWELELILFRVNLEIFEHSQEQTTESNKIHGVFVNLLGWQKWIRELTCGSDVRFKRIETEIFFVSVAGMHGHDAREEHAREVSLRSTDSGSDGGSSEVNDDDVVEDTRVPGERSWTHECVGVILLGVKRKSRFPFLINYYNFGFSKNKLTLYLYISQSYLKHIFCTCLSSSVWGAPDNNILPSPVLKAKHVGVHEVHVASEHFELVGHLLLLLAFINKQNSIPGNEILLLPAIPHGWFLPTSRKSFHVSLNAGTWLIGIQWDASILLWWTLGFTHSRNLEIGLSELKKKFQESLEC